MHALKFYVAVNECNVLGVVSNLMLLFVEQCIPVITEPILYFKPLGNIIYYNLLKLPRNIYEEYRINNCSHLHHKGCFQKKGVIDF